MLRLENTNPNLGPGGFIFNTQSGVRVSKYDPGFPEIRGVVDDVPQAHGTEDYSTFFGARTITLEFTLYAPWARNPTNRRKIIDDLNGLCNPRLRPFLYESVDNQPERRIMLRPDSLSLPFTLPHANFGQMTFIAPLGIWESGLLYLAEVGPGSGGGGSEGRSYPLEYDRTYIERAPAGGKSVTNDGNIESYPAMIIYGPCTAVTIGNETTGKEMVFPDLVLADGESVVIDNRRRSVVDGLNPTTVSMYDQVDWSASSWLTLVPGENQLSFNPTGYTASTKMSVAYRHNWI